jgi:hypothetical protein
MGCALRPSTTWSMRWPPCRAALVRDISQLKRRSERRHREMVAIAVLNREQSRECCGETVRLYEVRQQRQRLTDGLDERSK